MTTKRKANPKRKSGLRKVPREAARHKLRRKSSRLRKSTRPKRLGRAKARLSFTEVETLVTANNNCTLSTNLIISICWKESSFDPGAAASTSSATGLMMMTKGAVTDVNQNTPQGVHFEHSEMTDATKNIQCATWYLSILLRRCNQDVTRALERYGTGTGYATNLLKCETCLQSNSKDPMNCLKAIHP